MASFSTNADKANEAATPNIVSTCDVARGSNLPNKPTIMAASKGNKGIAK